MNLSIKVKSLLLLTILFSYSAFVMADEPLYTVTDNNFLDAETYRGFIIHRNLCARCHGNFAQGMIGPNLAQSMTKMSREDFEKIVKHGRNAMPPWESNAQVMDGLDNLYAYFKARSDGAIGEVRPKQAP